MPTLAAAARDDAHCATRRSIQAYRPRAAEHTVLHRIVRAHLATFLAAAESAGGVPPFVEREFRQFLGCGVWARGFARFRCETCHAERLVPFSCKARAVCPSCGGRRMAERAAHLVDHVLPAVPVRQWVLSLRFRLRYVNAVYRRHLLHNGAGRALLYKIGRIILVPSRDGRLNAANFVDRDTRLAE